MADDFPLLSAVRCGNVRMVRALLSGGADVNEKSGTFHLTPLHVAVCVRNFDILKILLISGAKKSVNLVDHEGYTPLFLAVKCRCHPIVEMLVVAGADVGVKNNQGLTAMEYAVDECDSNMVEILIFSGADVYSRGKLGQTALHLAAKFNNPLLAEDLLLRGVDPNVRDNLNRTALHYAAIYVTLESHLSVIEVLLKYKADVNAADGDGKTPHCYLVRNPRHVSDKIFKMFFCHILNNNN